jgi:hypothetical protein
MPALFHEAEAEILAQLRPNHPLYQQHINRLRSIQAARENYNAGLAHALRSTYPPNEEGLRHSRHCLRQLCLAL